MVKRFKRNFFQLLVSYLVVLVLPVGVSLAASALNLQMQRQTLLDNCSSAAESNEREISNALRSLENYVYQLSRTDQVQELLQTEPSDSINLAVYSQLFRRSLPKADSFNTATRNYLTTTVLFFKNGVVVNGNSVYYTPSWNVDHSIQNIPYSRWEELLFQEGHLEDGSYLSIDTLREDESLDSSVLLNISHLPLGYPEYAQGAVVLFLNRDKLESALKKGLEWDGSYGCILDESGQQLLSYGDESAANALSMTEFPQSNEDSHWENVGDQTTVLSIQSSYNGWQYLWVLPNDGIFARSNFLFTNLLLILLCLLLFSVGLAFLVAYRQNRPVKEIAKMLLLQRQDASEKENIQNSRQPPTVLGSQSSSTLSKAANASDKKENGENFATIKRHIQYLLQHSSQLEYQLAQSQEILIASVLDRLLDGKPVQEDAQRLILQEFSNRETASCFAVLLLKIRNPQKKLSDLSNLQIQRSIMASFLREQLSNAILHPMGENKLVIIMAMANEVPGEKRRCAGAVHAFLEEKGHTNISIGIGETVKSLSQLYLSYRSACADLSGTDPNGVPLSCNGSASFQKIEAERLEPVGQLLYPIESEQRILSLAHSGECEELDHFLLTLYEDNRKRNPHTEAFLTLLIVELMATFCKIVGTNPAPDLLSLESSLLKHMHSLNSEHPDQEFDFIRNQYRLLASHYEQEASDPSSILVKNITDYLDDAYMDQSITLTKLADRFHLSEAYLSWLFKEVSGENFSAYLERVRMKNAHVLLSETNLSIDEIAKKTGYNSSDTFRKAFKRFHGITPLAYRISTTAKS